MRDGRGAALDKMAPRGAGGGARRCAAQRPPSGLRLFGGNCWRAAGPVTQPQCVLAQPRPAWQCEVAPQSSKLALHSSWRRLASKSTDPLWKVRVVPTASMLAEEAGKSPHDSPSLLPPWLRGFGITSRPHCVARRRLLCDLPVTGRLHPLTAPLRAVGSQGDTSRPHCLDRIGSLCDLPITTAPIVTTEPQGYLQAPGHG